MTAKETRVATEDCPLDCECYDEPLVEVQPGVYTNTNGGSGMSDHMKELIARKESKNKDLKIVQKRLDKAVRS